MTTEKMNIHKALCELKVLEGRIQSAYANRHFAFANKHGNSKVSGVSIDEFCKELKAAYQQANDLIRRRDAIKRAVVLSNAMTKVTIGGKEYTVAEAIEMKNNGIPMRKDLLNHLARDNMMARREADSNNGENLESRADAYIRNLFGPNTDLKGASEEVKKTRADFIAAQTMEVVDTINITDEMTRLENEINTFLVEIDSALSVSNALTEIEVEY